MIEVANQFFLGYYFNHLVCFC